MSQIASILPAGTMRAIGNASFDVPLPGLGLHLRSADRSQAVALADTSGSTLLNATLAWGKFILNQFFICYWDTQLTGALVRFSFGQVIFILLVVGLVFAAIILAFPGVTTILFSLVGLFLLAAAGVIGFSLATGWALFCWPAIPPIVWPVVLSFVAQIHLYALGLQCS